MESELDVLKKISRALADAKVEFMITGSMAMNYYAEPRMTRDIDIVLSLRRIEVPRLAEVLNDDFLFSIEDLFETVQKRGIINLVHKNSLIKIDLIIKKDAEYRQVEFARRNKISMSDFETTIVSCEDLILSKLEWAKDSKSELQTRDIKNLIQRTDLDQKYLNDWMEKLGLSNFYKEIING